MPYTEHYIEYLFIFQGSTLELPGFSLSTCEDSWLRNTISMSPVGETTGDEKVKRNEEVCILHMSC